MTQINQADARLGNLLRINQSAIKRLTSTAICPKKYYLEEITGEHKRQSTKAMAKGHYFEYKLWGTLPKEGHIPVAPAGRAKGSTSVEYDRIDKQVALFPEIMKKHGITVARTDYKLEVPFNNEILFHGTMDALVEYKGKPYILDLKMTGNVNAQFGDFAWGNFQTLKMEPDATGIYSHTQTVDGGGKQMDVIQAHAYMYLMEMFTKQRWGFLYGVFDSKPESEHKIIEIPYDKSERESLHDRMKGTRHKLNMFHELNYQPIASEQECKSCKVLDCPIRIKPEAEQEAEAQLTMNPIVSVQEKTEAQAEQQVTEEWPW